MLVRTCVALAETARNEKRIDLNDDAVVKKILLKVVIIILLTPIL